MTTASITALLYTDSEAADAALRAIALELLERGVALAGLVQHNQPRPGRSRCDMVLEDLATSELLPISQDRGPHARGCALDYGQLAVAIEMVSSALHSAPALVILNKFGKSEGEGGGFRPVIAEAVERAIPMLIAVPFRNLESWRTFTGDFAREYVLDALPHDGAGLCSALGLDGIEPASNVRLTPPHAALRD